MSPHQLTATAAIRIRRPPAEVFRVFTDATEMSKFWLTRRDSGLRSGETVKWFIGTGDDAPAIDVHISTLVHPEKILMEWGNQNSTSRVTWTFAAAPDNCTILSVEESGFSGDHDAVVARALDSTGGFNQVIVAAKVLVEHGIAVNVVADHA